ncbi:MAG: hypothetical protein OXS33_09760 [bacterium]|nr:hypothetical protein [bacterium]
MGERGRKQLEILSDPDRHETVEVGEHGFSEQAGNRIRGRVPFAPQIVHNLHNLATSSQPAWVEPECFLLGHRTVGVDSESARSLGSEVIFEQHSTTTNESFECAALCCV